MYRYSVGPIVKTHFYSNELNYMFSIQNQEQNANDIPLMIILLLELFWSFALILFVCELDERASIAFSEIDHMVGQFNSYHFSHDMKKMLPIVIAMVSTPFGISAFGSVKCSRETFRKVSRLNETTNHICISFIHHDNWTFFQVINTGFSYFMVLRRFRNWKDFKLTH